VVPVGDASGGGWLSFPEADRRVHYPKGGLGGANGYVGRIDIPKGTRYRLRYELMPEGNFDFRAGGNRRAVHRRQGRIPCGSGLGLTAEFVHEHRIIGEKRSASPLAHGIESREDLTDAGRQIGPRRSANHLRHRRGGRGHQYGTAIQKQTTQHSKPLQQIVYR
jgi:hypothetical protein